MRTTMKQLCAVLIFTMAFFMAPNLSKGQILAPMGQCPYPILNSSSSTVDVTWEIVDANFSMLEIGNVTLSTGGNPYVGTIGCASGYNISVIVTAINSNYAYQTPGSVMGDMTPGANMNSASVDCWPTSCLSTPIMLSWMPMGTTIY